MCFSFGALWTKISNSFFLSLNRFLTEIDFDYLLINDNLSMDNIQVHLIIKLNFFIK